MPDMERLRTLVAELARLHRQADDDPDDPYCPECQAYDGTGQPCDTSELVIQLRQALDS